jgi:hypothetical protein
VTVNFALLVQVFSCFFLTGLIWLIQIVNYPAFQFVDENRFHEFHRFHSGRITWIVAPIMFTELGSALWLTFSQGGFLWTANFASVVLVWLLTGFVSVPIHNKLALGKSRRLIEDLVKTNWLRTAVWSLRSLSLLALIHPLLEKLQ